MLTLPGNSEVAFASLNSINSNPAVFVEWNYNSTKPYVVASSSAGPLGAAAAWGNLSGWSIASNGNTYTASIAGMVADIDPTASAIGLFASATRVTANSTAISLPATPNSYYKAVFYVKADRPVISPAISIIPASAVSYSTNAAGSTASYYYRIVPMDSNGYRPPIDLDGLDIMQAVVSNAATTITLTWDTSRYSADAYVIYRGTASTAMQYVTTVSSKASQLNSFTIAANASSATFGINNARIYQPNESFMLLNINPNVQNNAIPSFSNLNNSQWKVLANTANSFTASLIYNPQGLPVATNYVATTTVSPASIKSMSYTDNVTIGANQVDSRPVPSTAIRVMPSVLLKLGGNPIETPQSFVKVFETENSDPLFTKTMIDVDGVHFKKVEVFFGSPDAFDSVQMDIDIDASYTQGGVTIYRPEVHQVTDWDFFNSAYYPIESPFQTNRPGEALLHPYLQQADGVINAGLLTASATKVKPVSYAVFNPDKLFGNIAPYKQMYDSTLNNTMRYYVSGSLGFGTMTSPMSIRAQYNNYMSVNKIVVKGSNAFTDLTTASGSIVLLTPGGSVTIPYAPGAFDASGLLDLYYTGSSWTTNRPTNGSFPPELTDSGGLQNVTSSVTGIIFTINSMNQAPSATIGTDNIIRAHIIEISPRLEVDVSALVQEFTVTKSLDSENLANGFPIGFLNANSAKVTLSNLPVYKNDWPHTIFEVFSNNATFSNLLRKGVKFTAGLTSPQNDFTDFVPAFTMYAEDWESSGITTIDANLFDNAKNALMGKDSVDYMGDYENMFSTLTNIMDISGFSDYDYDSLKAILRARAANTSHFWTDRKTQSVADILIAFFVSHQIGAVFDEYGILRFIDLDKIINDYYDDTFDPDFAITDRPIVVTKASGSVVNEIPYISNIYVDSYSTTAAKKIGKISLQYSVPVKAFTDQVNFNGVARKDEQPLAAWSSPQAAVIKSFADKSVLSNQNYIYTNPDRSMLKTPNVTPRFTLGEMQGTAFLQGELISWTGLGYKFTPNTGIDGSIVSPIYGAGMQAQVSGVEDVTRYVTEFTNQDARVSSIMYDFTGEMLGIVRGQRMTSIRNHYLFDDSSVTPTGYVNSANYFSKKLVSSSTTTTTLTPAQSNSTVSFDKNIATFVARRQPNGHTRPIYISPKKSTALGDYNVPVAASTFNYFSFIFSGPNFAGIKNWATLKDDKQLEVGIYINTTAGKFMFALTNDKNKTYLRPAYDPSVGDTYTQYVLRTSATVRSSAGAVPAFQTKNVFDGHSHRLGVIFHSNRDYANVSQPQNGKMIYNYVTFYVDNVRYGPFALANRNLSKMGVQPTDEFGFYVKNISVNGTGAANFVNPLTVHLTEMYAARWFDGLGHELSKWPTMHHWESPTFLTNIVNNQPGIEPPYFMWGPNYLTGVHFYDSVDLDTSPFYPNTLAYNYAGYDPGAVKAPYPVLSKATMASLTGSKLYATPFRARFALENLDSQIVFLATSDGKVDNGSITPFSLTGFYNKMSDSVTLERIIDPTAAADAISLSTSWLQSPSDAERLMEKVALFANTFNGEVNISIFGNPLIQVGDYAQMVFAVKKIGYDPESPTVITPKVFFVKSVVQNYGAGLKTDLVLKPMFQLPQ